MRYTVVLEQEEDGGYVASVPALPGCVTQGDNRAEAMSNIREAIALYVEDCRDAGDPVPTEAGKEFIENPLMDAMGIFPEDQLQVTVSGHSLIITPRRT